MKSHFLKIISVIMAITLLACSFASCQVAIKEEPAGNGGMDIAGPSDDYFGTDDNLNQDNSGIGTQNPGNTVNPTSPTAPADRPTNPPVTPSTSGSTDAVNRLPQIDWAGTANDAEKALQQFYTHFDTPEERKEILHAAGYEYDEEQDIFYSHLNPWQRYFGFHDIYDRAAPITNMWYLTLKIDFTYGFYDWRLQWWKGQYGVLEGAELGVYTKDKGTPGDFYECAADVNLLKMEFTYYQSAADYNQSNPLFTRYEQEHWWLTGFKFGVTQPTKNVVKAVLYARDTEMADKIEIGLQNVTDDKGNWNGFTSYRPGTNQTNFYVRKDNMFEVIWKTAGYVNYSYMMDGNQDDAEIPTE